MPLTPEERTALAASARDIQSPHSRNIAAQVLGGYHTVKILENSAKFAEAWLEEREDHQKTVELATLFINDWKNNRLTTDSDWALREHFRRLESEGKHTMINLPPQAGGDAP